MTYCYGFTVVVANKCLPKEKKNNAPVLILTILKLTMLNPNFCNMKGQEVAILSLDGRVAEYHLCFVKFPVAYTLLGGNGTVRIKVLDKERNTIRPSQREKPGHLVELLGRSLPQSTSVYKLVSYIPKNSQHTQDKKNRTIVTSQINHHVVLIR